MGTTSLEAKKAYVVKTRKSNYMASLRLEGFDVTPSDGTRSTPSRDEILKTFSKSRA